MFGVLAGGPGGGGWGGPSPEGGLWRGVCDIRDFGLPVIPGV
jgi:hypothetical protein